MVEGLELAGSESRAFCFRVRAYAYGRAKVAEIELAPFELLGFLGTARL